MTSVSQKQRWHDPRTPTSVAHVGRYTIRVFDEQEYQANIAQYYDVNEKPETRKQQPRIYPKQKQRFDWTPKGDYMTKKGA